MKKYTNFDEKNKKVLSDYFEFKNNKYMNEKTFKSERGHFANFCDDDFVINIMGINPSVPKEERRENYADNEFILGNDLDLFYVPKYDTKYKEKYNNYVLGTNFSRSQYKILNDEIFGNKDKYLKMSWQKYDEQFLKEVYGEIKAKEYTKILEEINSEYKKNDIKFEEKYLIFTNLIYVSNHNQKIIESFINEHKYVKDINELFMEQLEYYNAKITLISNSAASHYVERNILKKYDCWEKVIFNGDEEYSDFCNLYIHKNKKCYIYLTSRYFDGRTMNEFTKRLFIKEMKKLIKIANS